jgi:hypothetical protein
MNDIHFFLKYYSYYSIPLEYNTVAQTVYKK